MAIEVMQLFRHDAKKRCYLTVAHTTVEKRELSSQCCEVQEQRSINMWQYTMLCAKAGDKTAYPQSDTQQY